MSNISSASIKKVFVSICCITAMIFACVLSGCSGNANATDNSNSNSASSAGSNVSFSAKATFNVTADGYVADTSSPIFVNVTDKNGTSVSHAINANTDQSVEFSAPGDYTISFVSPINADGSIYSTENSNLSFNVSSEGVISSVDKKDYSTTSAKSDEKNEKNSTNSEASTSTNVSDNTISVKLDKIDADNVTREQLEKVQLDIAKAIANGDDNIKKNKENIAEVVKKNSSAAAAATSTDDSKSNKNDKNSATDASTSEKTSGNDANGTSNSTDNSSSDNNSSSQPSTSNGSTAQQTSGGGNAGGTRVDHSVVEEEMRQAAERHYHDFSVPIVETSTYTTVVCNACGAEFSSGDAWYDHSMACYNSGDKSHGSYSTVQHIVEETVGWRCECGATS